MEWELTTESAIAKLMGLDQLRCPRQHFRKHRRVLSDGYIHKAAAVGVRKGSLVSSGCKNENVNAAVKDVLGIESFQGIRIMEPSNALLSKSFRGQVKQSLGKEGENCHRGNVLYKPEHDLVAEHGIYYVNEPSKFGLGMVMKRSVAGRELEKVTYHVKDGNSCIHSTSGYREQNGFSRGNCHVTLPRRACVGCARNMNRVSQKLQSSRKLAEVSIPGYTGEYFSVNGNASHLSHNQSSPEMQRVGRWGKAKVVRRIDFSERGESPRMLAVADKEVMVGKVKDSFSSGQELKQDDTPKGGSDCNQFKTSLVESDTKSQSSKISDEDIEDGMDIGSETDKSLALVNEFAEGSTYSNGSRIGTPEFQETPKRTNQHSPDSVLEPFFGHRYYTNQCFESIGLQLQLQVLNLETEDSCSEGSMMGVSGDNDSDEQFSNHPHEGRKVIRTWLGDEESRNFSYMVDVLDEAGFFGIKFDTWHSLKCPISPSVFDLLEKKYGKQTSWQKSDRWLLFDSINIGLMGIYNPVMNPRPSIKGSLLVNMRRDEIEDRLWTMLLSEGKEKSKVALEEWFEAEEGMNVVCNQLVSFIFDDLVQDLVS